MTPEPLTPDERVIPPEMIEAAAKAMLEQYPLGAWIASREALVAAGVPALLEERDRLRAAGDELADALQRYAPVVCAEDWPDSVDYLALKRWRETV